MQLPRHGHGASAWRRGRVLARGGRSRRSRSRRQQYLLAWSGDRAAAHRIHALVAHRTHHSRRVVGLAHSKLQATTRAASGGGGRSTLGDEDRIEVLGARVASRIGRRMLGVAARLPLGCVKECTGAPARWCVARCQKNALPARLSISERDGSSDGTCRYQLKPLWTQQVGAPAPKGQQKLDKPEGRECAPGEERVEVASPRRNLVVQTAARAHLGSASGRNGRRRRYRAAT